MIARAGMIYGHVLENPGMGVPRDLYWNLRVAFPDAEQGEVESMAVEWMTFAVPDWRGLGGLTAAELRDPGRTECSVYRDGEHLMVSLRSLLFGAVAGAGDLSVVLIADDPEGGAAIRVEADLTFEGIVIVPGNVFPKPSSGEEVRMLAASFTDVTILGEPIWDRFRWILPPIR